MIYGRSRLCFNPLATAASSSNTFACNSNESNRRVAENGTQNYGGIIRWLNYGAGPNDVGIKRRFAQIYETLPMRAQR